MARSFRTRSLLFFRVPFLLALGIWLSAGSLLAQAQQQNASGVTTVFKVLQQSTNAWVNPIMNAATDLFWLLATIEFAWAGLSYLREHDIGGLFIALFRRILIIRFFVAVLIKGQQWIPMIISSFVQIGSNASGLPQQLDPAAMLADGLGIVNQLGNTIQFAGMFTNPGAALMTVAVSLIVMAAYVLIVFHYLVTKLESIILLSAGYVFVGFGGHSATRPYLERYISLAVGTGVRLMVIYLMLGAFHSLSQQWVQDMSGFTAQQSFDTLFPTLCAIVLYALASWKIPKLCGSLASGSLGMGGGDLVGPMVAGAELAATAALMAGTAAVAAPAVVAEGAVESSLVMENFTADAFGAVGGMGGGGTESFAAGGADWPGPPPSDPSSGSSGSATAYPGPPPSDGASFISMQPDSDGVYSAGSEQPPVPGGTSPVDSPNESGPRFSSTADSEPSPSYSASNGSSDKRSIHPVQAEDSSVPSSSDGLSSLLSVGSDRAPGSSSSSIGHEQSSSSESSAAVVGSNGSGSRSEARSPAAPLASSGSMSESLTSDVAGLVNSFNRNPSGFNRQFQSRGFGTSNTEALFRQNANGGGGTLDPLFAEKEGGIYSMVSSGGKNFVTPDPGVKLRPEYLDTEGLGRLFDMSNFDFDRDNGAFDLAQPAEVTRSASGGWDVSRKGELKNKGEGLVEPPADASHTSGETSHSGVPEVSSLAPSGGEGELDEELSLINLAPDSPQNGETIPDFEFNEAAALTSQAGHTSNESGASGSPESAAKLSYTRLTATTRSWQRTTESGSSSGRRRVRIPGPSNDGAGHVPPPQIRMDGE